jgi:hypothetical protein
MSEIFKRLKEAQDKRNTKIMPELEQKHGYEILEGLTNEEQARIVGRLFQERLARTQAIRVKGTCPHCRERISLRFRFRLKPKKTSTIAESANP